VGYKFHILTRSYLYSSPQATSQSLIYLLTEARTTQSGQAPP